MKAHGQRAEVTDMADFDCMLDPSVEDRVRMEDHWDLHHMEEVAKHVLMPVITRTQTSTILVVGLRGARTCWGFTFFIGENPSGVGAVSDLLTNTA